MPKVFWHVFGSTQSSCFRASARDMPFGLSGFEFCDSDVYLIQWRIMNLVTYNESQLIMNIVTKNLNL